MKKALIGTALMLMIGLLASAPASAQADATVFVVHGINGEDLGLPKAAGVDVSVGGGCALTNFTYGTITGRTTRLSILSKRRRLIRR